MRDSSFEIFNVYRFHKYLAHKIKINNKKNVACMSVNGFFILYSTSSFNLKNHH